LLDEGRKHLVSVVPPNHEVEEAVRRALAEDLEPDGDLTAALIDGGAMGRLAFVAREPGVIAGQACVVETFRQLSSSLVVQIEVQDGGQVEPGAVVATVEGPLREILTGERTALNFLGHLSGIATQTAAMVAVVRAVSATVSVLDTRKTTPGLRALEKAAVRAGGGTNHRYNLSDAILIKDNHLTSLSVADAVARARVRWPGRSVEVECDSIDQLEEAARAGADSVLLDNMTPSEAKAATARGRELSPAMLIEVSGGITLETAAAYARTGVDLISSGSLTHSVKSLDFGLDLEQRKE
jgi:nicotinate-nucleotide pyrophosphorylase (carboxylating)